MKWIAITGGIATGKTTVTKIIQDLGGVVIDADVLAREVVESGSFGLCALVQLFGPKVLTMEREKEVLNRDALGKIIFQDTDLGRGDRMVTERILHPLIQWRALKEKELLARQGLSKAFYDAALVFEKKMQDKFDAVILVSASFETQKSRLMKRNGLSAAEAERRIKMQMPLFEKTKLADHIIENDGDMASTKKQVQELLKKF